MTWRVLEWDQISVDTLYQILALRSEVFVVEQNCVYQDIDGKDSKATHVLGYINKELVAYSRIFKPGIFFKQASFGRTIVRKNHRSKNYGHDLVAFTLNTMGNQEEIKISAQQHLSEFYKRHGFTPVGASYLEDGIPHIAMVKKLSKN